MCLDSVVLPAPVGPQTSRMLSWLLGYMSVWSSLMTSVTRVCLMRLLESAFARSIPIGGTVSLVCDMLMALKIFKIKVVSLDGVLGRRQRLASGLFPLTGRGSSFRPFGGLRRSRLKTNLLMRNDRLNAR